jgi:hypothetical protein
MRKWIVLGCLFGSIGWAAAQPAANVIRLGRWALGQCEVVHRRAGFLFVSSGPMLEVYQNKHGEYAKSDSILMPGLVRGVWVKNTLSHVYVACAGAGLRVVSFDAVDGQFVDVVGSLDTPGSANGVMQYGNMAYIADGPGGLAVVDVSDPSQPLLRGTLATAGAAQGVWVVANTPAVDNTMVLVAADSAGLYSVNVTNPAAPAVYDRLAFNSVYPGFQVPAPRAYQVTVIDTVAFIATGYGSLRSVNIRNPRLMSQLGVWMNSPYTEVLGLDVTWETVGGKPAPQFAYLASGTKGVFCPVNIQNPRDLKGPPFQNVDTRGTATRIVVSPDADSLFVGGSLIRFKAGELLFVTDRENGLLFVDARESYQPSVIDSIRTGGDICRDAAWNGRYAYVAAGWAGVKIVDTTGTSADPGTDRLPLRGTLDTGGEARGLRVVGSRLYVANGLKGLGIYSISDPIRPAQSGQFTAVTDTVHRVDLLSGSYAFLAAGRDGVRIVDISGSIFETGQSPLRTTGQALDVKISGSKAYVATPGVIYVYTLTQSGGSLTGVSATDSLVAGVALPMDARGLDVVGDTVFVANGRHGLLLWKTSNDAILRKSVDGVVTDITVREKTLYVSDGSSGFRIYDASTAGEVNEVGYYRTSGEALGLGVSDSDGKAVMADGRYGFWLFRSRISPAIAITPATLNFGLVPPDYSRSLTALIRNTGTSILKVTNIQSKRNTYSFSATRFDIAAGDTFRLVIRFSPSYETWPFRQDDRIEISTNDPSNLTAYINLQAEVTALVTEGPYTPDDFTVGLWHFDEADGVVTAADASGNSLHGQLAGTPFRENSTRSGYGRQIGFDSETDRVLVAQNPLFNFSETSFTAECWFSMDALPTDHYVLMRHGSDSNAQFELALGSGDVGLIGRVWDGSGGERTLTSGSIDLFNVDQWYHAALTWNGDSLKLYLNGVLKAGRRVQNRLKFVATEPLAIGANQYGTAVFRGSIDDVRLSDIARESWEYHVTRSRIALSQPIVQFGNVLANQTRTVPLAVSNLGSQPLVVQSVTSGNAHVTVTPSGPFTLFIGQTDTLDVSFSPVGVEVLTQGSLLQIRSNDPTYPVLAVPLRGNGISSLPAGPYATDPMTLGLWHLDESSGLVARDSSGNAMNGTLSGSVARESVTRKFDPGSALRFDGQSGLVSARPSAGVKIEPTWGGITAEAWFYLQGLPLGRGTLMRRASGAAAQFHLYVDSTAALVGQMFNTQQQAFTVTSASMGALKIRQWYHAAAVLEGDSVRLYVNGNSVAVRPFSGSLAGGGNPAGTDSMSVLIGSSWNRSTPFYGVLDEIRLSSVARQPWEFNVNLARIGLNPESLAFENVLLGQERTLSLTVGNTGIDNLVVTDIVSSLPSVFTVDTTHFTVASGASRRIHVTYDPQATGAATAQLTFRSNDPFWPNRTVPLSGSGLAERSFTRYAADVFTLGLFHMDETADTARTILDSSAVGLRGTMETGVSRSDSGRFGRALRFANGSVRIPTAGKLSIPDDAFTLEFWFNLQTLPTASAVLLKQGNGDTATVEISLVNSPSEGLTAKFWNGQGVSTSLKTGSIGATPRGQWMHAAVTFASDTLKLYLNNSLRDRKAFAGPLRQARASVLRLGSGLARENPFAGMLDEIRISRIARAYWEIHVVPPTIEAAPLSLNFAAVLKSETRVFPFWVRNTGDQDLSVSSITGMTPQFSIPDSVRAFTLRRLQTRMVAVTYSPDSVNVTQRAVLTITCNDPESPAVHIALEGRGAEFTGRKEYASDAHTLALYHLNSAQSDTAADASGNGRHGVLQNDAVWASAGFFGSAIVLDGDGDRIIVQADSAFVMDYDRRSFTLECYFKTDTLSQSILSLGYTDARHSRNFGLTVDSEGRLSIDHFGSGGPRVNDAAWHFVAFSYNHLLKRGRLFVDTLQVWERPLVAYTPKNEFLPLVIGAAQADSVSFEGHFKGAIDEVRISDIVRESWEFQVIDYGIRVQSITPDPPNAGSMMTMIFSIPSALQPQQVILYYRQGGQISYRSVQTERQTNSVYKTVIPAEHVTERGFEYYIEVRTALGDITMPGIDPEQNPMSRSIRTVGLSSGITFRAREFQMFSIPMNLDTATVKSVLEDKDDFGSYDPFQWRLFWWHRLRQRYITYNNTDTTRTYFDLSPSRAYWLVSSTEKTFDLGNARTVSLDSVFRVTIDPGWNMIGNPFNFTVRWQDCSLSSDSIGTLYYFNPEEGYGPDWQTLDPWKGYWIYNADTVSHALFIPPKSRGLAKTGGNRPGLAESLGKGEWLLQFSAGTKQQKDGVHYAGVKRGAKDGWDVWDRPDPPPVESRISAGFDHGDWGRHAGTYAADIRNSETEGQVWSLFVETRNAEEQVTLAWHWLASMPSGWKAFLFDLAEGTSLDMTELGVKTFKCGNKAPDVRLFKLVAGSEAFIRAESEGIPLGPVVFHVFQNYPNPFNPETTIRYRIPKNGNVEVTVFNSLGQKIRSLVDEVQKTGEHTAVWDGSDDAGRSVPSGLYVTRVKTSESTSSRKMLLVR